MPFLRVCQALYDYDANTEEELTIKENDVLYILEDDDPEWWKAKLKTVDPNELHVGLVPSNYVEPLPASGNVVGLYKYDATTEEELTFEEGDALTLYEQDDPDWLLVGNATHVGFVPGNYVEASAGQDGHTLAQQIQEQYQDDYAEEQYQQDDQQYDQEPPAEAIPRSNGSTSSPTVTTAVPAEKDDLKFWSVNEVDKKKKKKKGSLGVGNLTIFFGSEEDKSPVRQWSIKDVEKVRQEKKHVYLELGGSSPASFDFQAASKQEAEAIFNKIQESKQKSRISHPTAAASVSAPSVRDSVVSTSTYQTAQGSPSLSSASATYHQPEPVPEDSDYEQEQQYIEPEPLCEGRWAIAMYDFQAEAEEELSIRENDELWVTDYVSSEEWWKVQLGDQVGIVPASYVRFADEPAPEEPQEEVVPVQAEEPVAAEAPGIPTPAVAAPKAIQAAKKEVAATPTATAAPPVEPANKPKNTRMWTDRSGKYKVEAEYLGFHDGKISLHKLNGVKIAVPVREMSQEDINYVEKATGMKVSEAGFDWYDFFIKAGIATEDALRYSTIFRTEKMDSSILPELSRDVLKGLNVKEGDIIRIRKAIGGTSGSGSGSPNTANGVKPKKSVSFAASHGGADVVDDREMAMKLQADEVSNARTSGASLAEQRRQQELADEQFARELQERENATNTNRTPVFGKKKDEPQRKNTRPKATTSAPKTIDASEFTKIGTALNNAPKLSSSSSASKSKQPAASKASGSASAANLAFDDDAWEVRDPKLLAFDYDNWKVQNRDNEDEWIEKFASSTAPKIIEEEEPAKTSSPKPKDIKADTASPAGRPRPGAPGRTDSSNSLTSLGLAAPLAPSSPAPASPAAVAAVPKSSVPVPGSLESIALKQKEEAERVKEQMQKIKERQASDSVKMELEQVKQQQQMLQQALVQQANQNQQLVQTIRRMAPPPPVSSGRLPAPLVPVNPTGPLRFVPTHPTGQQSTPQPTFSTASMGLPTMQQQMMTGVNPQMTGISSQPTGKASWVNATPANPFGIGAITVNPTGIPARAPQTILAARSAPPVPAPFINRNMSQGPPPPPPPMQTSMATGFNNNSNNLNAINNMRTGVNNNMTGMGNNMAGITNNMTGMNNLNSNMTGVNNMPPMNRSPMQSTQFQSPVMTGMSQSSSAPSLNVLSAMNSMNNMNSNNNSPLFQSPMLTGMNNNMNNGIQQSSNNMGGLNNNMTGMNNMTSMNNNMTGMNNSMTGMNNNMAGMNNLNSNMTGMNSMNNMNNMGNNNSSLGSGLHNSMTGMSSFNKSPSLSNTFSSSPMGQSRILQTSSSPAPSFGGGSGFGGMNSSNSLGGMNALGSTNTGGNMTPLQPQSTGHLPMASSYMRPPTSSGLGGGFNNNNNMGGMNSQMTGMGSMGGMNNSMGGMGSMGSMNGNMNGMGGMNNNNLNNNNQMSGMGGMNNMSGMGGMGGMNNNMGGMGSMGGVTPQMTGMGNMNNNNMNMNNNMAGMNGGMGGMNPQMTGMNNMNNMNNNGQFQRNW
ncbi:cytoskeletal protein binding protein [Mortierella claussenii]|nr:cytoskeletal protein binding protein [Mortierella claussenii]